MIWFTSDTHFNHNNIIHYCGRPYDSVDSMNVNLIYNWNSLIQPEDIVYHLGDFALGQAEKMPLIFNLLNGKKHLIRGNHDSKRTTELGWESVQPYYWLQGFGERVLLIHDPKNAKASAAPALVLHGHCHGQAEHRPFPKHPHLRYIDVGVDCWEMKPIQFDEIKKKEQDARRS